jgi:hydrogenase expression/formation protein HypE
MRDPTRGGLASALNEIARASRVSVRVREDRVPVSPGVRACCEILGLDPLYMACEGRVVIFAAPESSEDVLRIVRGVPGGENAALIGEVTGPQREPNVPPVVVETGIGTRRFLPLLEGDPVPRIC